MESMSRDARLAVEAFAEGRFDHYCRYRQELALMARDPDELHRYLTAAGLPLEMLKQAADAAARGDQLTKQSLLESARICAGTEEVDVLVESYRLNLTVREKGAKKPTRRERCGFAG